MSLDLSNPARAGARALEDIEALVYAAMAPDGCSKAKLCEAVRTVIQQYRAENAEAMAVQRTP